MPLALVQALDDSFQALEEWKNAVHSVREQEEKSKGIQDAQSTDATKEDTEDKLQEFTDAYFEAASTIYRFSIAPITCAVILRLVDLFLGPFNTWKHMSTWIATALVHKPWPTTPLIVISILSLMPYAISGTTGGMTSVVGLIFCLDAVASPLYLYLQEDISDRTEIRYVLIGFFLNLVYISAETAVESTKSTLLVLIYGLGCYAGWTLVHVLVYQDGWWDAYSKHSPGAVPGRYVQHSISRIIEYSTRFSAQQLIFPLNRFSRLLVAYASRLEPYWNQPRCRDAAEYQYNAIHSTDRIRLLKIGRKRPFQEMECQLVEIGLSESDEYEAVSYVWGDPARVQSILVDSRRLPITKSAYDILRRRWSTGHERLIWIDQVCINQDDDDEKAAQVQLMRRIYKGAKRVTAFLGDSEDAHLVESLFAELHFRKKGLKYSFEALKNLYQSEPKTEQWNAMAKFFGNPWFQRVWIVQEATSAKVLHLFYGDIVLDWVYMSRAVDVMFSRHMFEAFTPSVGLCSDERRDALIGIANVDIMLSFRGEVDYEETFSLSRVLQRCACFESTDPRDNVYALLGLTRDNSRDVIIPDYSEQNTTRSTFTKTMRYLLSQRNQPLDNLCGAGIGADRNIQELPSWVPDWSRTKKGQQDSGYHYTAGTQYNSVIGYDHSNYFSLRLEGIHFDRVKQLSSISEENPDWTTLDFMFSCKKWLSETEAVARSHAKDPYFNGQSVDEAFIRTLIWDQSSYSSERRPSTEQCFSDYNAVKSFHAISEILIPILQSQPPESHIPESPLWDQYRDIGSQASRFLHFAGNSLGMRFCVTEKGRMAIVPPLSNKGDIICVIKGARMPFVLRETSYGERSLYNLVGSCYVHGVMDGEIHDDSIDALSLGLDIV
jgi:hypothetical protein